MLLKFNDSNGVLHAARESVLSPCGIGPFCALMLTNEKSVSKIKLTLFAIKFYSVF
jgi:hypothetical protein